MKRTTETKRREALERAAQSWERLRAAAREAEYEALVMRLAYEEAQAASAAAALSAALALEARDAAQAAWFAASPAERASTADKALAEATTAGRRAVLLASKLRAAAREAEFEAACASYEEAQAAAAVAAARSRLPALSGET